LSVVEDVCVLMGRDVAVIGTRSGDEVVTGDLAALVHQERQVTQSRVVVDVEMKLFKVAALLSRRSAAATQERRRRSS
jgi:hypothetical protein